MYYGNLKMCDIANGDGIRVTLFVSGCTNRCKGCFQPETWDFCYGKEYTQETSDQIMKYLKLTGRQGLTVLGGEPFEPSNQRVIVELMRRVREECPEKNIWCYTGFTYDKLMDPEFEKHCEVTEEMMSYIDVLVDGPFVQELKDLTLKYRGSKNQRLLRLKDGKIISIE